MTEQPISREQVERSIERHRDCLAFEDCAYEVQYAKALLRLDDALEKLVNWHYLTADEFKTKYGADGIYAAGYLAERFFNEARAARLPSES